MSDRGSSQQDSGTPPLADPVALVNGKPITLAQLQRPLLEAYGLQFLLHLTQLEICRQKAAALGIVVTPQDVAEERQRTLEQMFKDAVSIDESLPSEQQARVRQQEYERLMRQFLATQRLTEQELELVMQINAHLRKLAEPGLRDRITEENLREGFGIMFGEKVRVRHIQLANLREVAEAQRRLKEGQPFEQVAAEMSTDLRTRARGGEVRAFSRAEPSWPQAFKDAAFALKEPGEVSEPVHSGDSIHLIKLIARIPPNQAVRYETHRDIVMEELYKGLLAARIRQIREQVAMEARSSLQIQDPVLRRQYVDRLERAAGEIPRDRDQIRRDIEADRAGLTPARSGVPQTQPAAATASQSTQPSSANPE